MEQYFDVGVIVKPQGIHGELRVLPVTDDPDRFARLQEVTVVVGREAERVYNIESARRHGSLVIVKLTGINDRDAAELLVGGVLKIPPEQALPLEENEYYLRDLLDMDVWTEDDEHLGVIEDVLRTGANDVYVVKQDKTQILIPAIRDCIQKVDVKGKRMTVRLMDGLRS